MKPMVGRGKVGMTTGGRSGQLIPRWEMTGVGSELRGPSCFLGVLSENAQGRVRGGEGSGEGTLNSLSMGSLLCRRWVKSRRL